MKTFKLYTLGCKVNQYETQAMREDLIASGLTEGEGKKPADFYIINSCTVTSRADGKSLAMLRQARTENAKAKVILTGCLVDGHEKSLLPKNTPANLIVKNQLKHRLAEILKTRKAQNGQTAAFIPLKISSFKGHSRAFVKIQDGCDNACAYCKIPLVRGKSRSRQLSEIIEEVERLTARGFKEIVLTGICLGAYGKDISAPGKAYLDLSDLIAQLENIQREFRIRLSSIEAKDINERLMEKIARSPKMCKHLHIPFQSGDDEILRKMHRHYLVQDYLQVVKRVRRKIPDIAITTDIMVGFPSESESNFLNTLQFIEKVAPSRIHIFPFSPRPGTLAEKLPHRVPVVTIKKRERILQSLANKKSRSYHRRFKGRSLTVLTEHARDKKGGLLKGYTENYIPVLFKGSDGLMGDLVKIKIERIEPDAVLARQI